MTRLEEFKQEKFGLFVHFGLYAIPAGVWKGKRAPHGTEWLMRNMEVPLAEYRRLAAEFNPQAFDASYYVRLAKECGMRYVVVTAKHHDGFAMYDSAVSEYKITNTPFGRDIIREFADACAEENMTFGIYYSQMQDWEHPDGDGNNFDFDKEKKNFRRYFNNKCIPQVKELLTNYGKVGLIWFDTPYDMPKALCQELADTVKACQRDCLINGRIGYGLGDYRQMSDNSIPHNAYFGAWEVPMTMNHTWGYSSFDTDWASPEKIIQNLATIVSKGGNLLLNIGPDANGRIPTACEDILHQVGAWMKENGESIYGTTAIPDFPYEMRFGRMTYCATTHTLYYHVPRYSGEHPRIAFVGLHNQVLSAKVLKTGENLSFRRTYEMARDEERFAMELPLVCPDPYDTVVALQLDGDIKVQKLL